MGSASSSSSDSPSESYGRREDGPLRSLSKYADKVTLTEKMPITYWDNQTGDVVEGSFYYAVPETGAVQAFSMNQLTGVIKDE